MYHVLIFYSDGYLGYTHVANEISFFVVLVCRNFHENPVIYVSCNTSSFRVYTFAAISDLGIVEHNGHVVRYLYVCLPCTVKCDTCL